MQVLPAARIDRLPPEENACSRPPRSLAQRCPAAVAGHRLYVLDAASYRSLAHLQAAEFLYETSLFPERAYTFKHVAGPMRWRLESAGRSGRALHARIVEALEALLGDRWDTRWSGWRRRHALRGEAVDKKVFTYGRQAGQNQRDSPTAKRRRCMSSSIRPRRSPAVGPPPSRPFTSASAHGDPWPAEILPADARPLAPRRDPRHGAWLPTARTRLRDPDTNCWNSGEVDRAIDYGQRTLALA